MHRPLYRSSRPRTGRLLFAAAIAALSTAGCATPDGVRYGEVTALPAAYTPAQRPLTIGDIIAAIRNGFSQREIADEIEERGLVAPANSADIDLLLQSGANSELIDAVRDASAAPPAAYAPQSPPIVTAPPVIVTPPAVPFYPDYGWYPYAPYSSFGFWYNDPPRFRPRFRHDDRRDDRRDRGRFDDDRRGRPAPGAAAPNWQSPRAPGGSTAPSPGFIDRNGRQRVPLDPRPNQLWQIPEGSPPAVNRAPQPRGSMGAPRGDGGGGVRNRRSVPD